MDDIMIFIYGFHDNQWNKIFINESILWTQIKKTYNIIYHRHIDDINSLEILNKYSSNVNIIIIPLLEKHIKDIIKIQNKSNKQTALIPSEIALNTFENKQLFWNLLKNNDMLKYTPETYDYLTLNNIKYPCIIKPTNLNCGKYMCVVDNDVDLINGIKRVKNYQFIVQEYICDPNEYVTHCVVKNGKIMLHVSYVYECSDKYFIKGISSVKLSKKWTLLDNDLEIFEKILKLVNFSGICNLNYKYNKENIPLIFEINPRLGGSLMANENINDLVSLIETTIRLTSEN
jgi:carbamoylphosphate synthase large subunit